MEDLKVSKIFQMKDVIDSLTLNFQDNENMPVTTYKLAATIEIKVFNYKQTVESIESDEGQSLNDDIYPCKCGNSELCNPDHGHIITGDLSLLKNEKIWKLFTNGSNFREPQSFLKLFKM